jgi:hypothetical protein
MMRSNAISLYVIHDPAALRISDIVRLTITHQ